MYERPLLIFDVNETLLDLDALAPHFERIYASLPATPGTFWAHRRHLISGEAVMRVGLAQALNLTFWAMLALSLITVCLALLVPPTAITDSMTDVSRKPLAAPQPESLS
jgi:hypothetical protein